MTDLGRVAFDAYRQTVTGAAASWDELNETIQAGWEAAAGAVDSAVVDGGLSRWAAYVTWQGKSFAVSVFCGQDWPPTAAAVVGAARAQLHITQPGVMCLATVEGRELEDDEKIRDEALTLRARAEVEA